MDWFYISTTSVSTRRQLQKPTFWPKQMLFMPSVGFRCDIYMAARSFKILMHESDGGDTDKGYCFVIISISYKDCAPISLVLCSAKFDRVKTIFVLIDPV